MDERSDQAERLKGILLGNREAFGNGLPEDVLIEIAEIEEQNQFDDDRASTQKAIRDLISAAAKSLRLAEASDS
jgi:hypothetical protein